MSLSLLENVLQFNFRDSQLNAITVCVYDIHTVDVELNQYKQIEDLEAKGNIFVVYVSLISMPFILFTFQRLFLFADHYEIKYLEANLLGNNSVKLPFEIL